MNKIILDHIIELFGESQNPSETKHHSYCMAPWEECSCKRIPIITEDTKLMDGGYIDSFSMVSVLIFLEKTFDIKIPDSDAIPSNFNTVNKMIELVNKFKK